MMFQPQHTVKKCLPTKTQSSLRVRYRLLAECLFFLSSLLMFWNLGRMLYPTVSQGAGCVIFKFVAWFVYSFLYCVPLYIILLFAGYVLSVRVNRGSDMRSYPVRTTCFCFIALVGMFVTQVLVYTDSWVYAIFQFHLNGFVLNLLMTPGGLASMDMSTGSYWSFIGRLLMVLVLQGVVLVIAVRSKWIFRWQQRIFRGYKSRLAFMGCLVILTLGQMLGYGLARVSWYRPVLQVADTIPFYIPVTFNHLARHWGWNVSDTNLPSANDTSLSLNYPIHPLRFGDNSPRYNVMILMCETLRADMLTQEIMPETFAFAKKNLQFMQHYSSGNGTREGVFGAMTGLYGSYWRNMLRDNRGSAFVRLLQDNDYDLELYTSQSFSYPEFDRTVFATVAPEHMHVHSDDAPSWQRDRNNVADIIHWLSAREKGVPFMTFMFFESPHARYVFPPESVIRPDYCKTFDYANLVNPTPAQTRQIFNRYVNSVHHLDSQIARLVEYLKTSGQLANTILVITGDHGEAFYEKGRWGHGGHSFLEEQERVPLIMHIPGVSPRVFNDLSSHVDIVPTILTKMGVTNPCEDYCVGRNLLQPTPSLNYVVSAGWDSMALITDHEKYAFSYRGFRLPEGFSRNDQPLNEKDVREDLQPQLLDLMKKMRLFLKR